MTATTIELSITSFGRRKPCFHPRYSSHLSRSLWWMHGCWNLPFLLVIWRNRLVAEWRSPRIAMKFAGGRCEHDIDVLLVDVPTGWLWCITFLIWLVPFEWMWNILVLSWSQEQNAATAKMISPANAADLDDRPCFNGSSSSSDVMAGSL